MRPLFLSREQLRRRRRLTDLVYAVVCVAASALIGALAAQGF